MIRSVARFVVILSAACLAMGGGVAALYGVWRDRIAERQRAATAEAIRAVLPPGAAVDSSRPLAGRADDGTAVYAARTDAGQTVAYVAAGAGQGYSSTVRVMVGARPADGGLEVVRVAVTSQAETPGLGAQVAEARSSYTLWQKLFGADRPEEVFNPFLREFEGKRPDEVGAVQAITAATITSNATKAAVQEALGRIGRARKETHE